MQIDLTALNRDDMESRRLQAAQDLLNGNSQSTVARKYRVSRTTASRWHRALVEKGYESLKKRRAPGRPSRLTSDQLTEVAEIFAEGPQAFGLGARRWTTAKMATAIEMRFGVRYDPDHVGRLMNRLGLGRKMAVMEQAAYVPQTYAPSEMPAILL